MIVLDQNKVGENFRIFYAVDFNKLVREDIKKLIVSNIL